MKPPAEYEDLTQEHPIRRVEQWNGRPAWFLTRHADVRALLMDPRASAAFVEEIPGMAARRLAGLTRSAGGRYLGLVRPWSRDAPQK